MRNQRVLVLLAASLLPAVPLPAASNRGYSMSGETFHIDRSLIGSGGTSTSIGGTYALRGSIGQSIAGSAVGTTYAIDAGFWHGVPDDCADCIFINGFESEE